jgi:hypothetical protein
LKRFLRFSIVGHHASIAVHPNPPQPIPVVLVVIDKDRNPRVRHEVADAFEVGGPFGLGVDGEVERLLIEREGDRHYMRLSVNTDGGQSRNRRRRESAPHLTLVHQRSLRQTPLLHERSLGCGDYL